MRCKFLSSKYGSWTCTAAYGCVQTAGTRGDKLSLPLYSPYSYAEFLGDTHYSPDVGPALLSPATRDKFLWLTHTYNHIDMYCIEGTLTLSVE